MPNQLLNLTVINQGIKQEAVHDFTWRYTTD